MLSKIWDWWGQLKHKFLPDYLPIVCYSRLLLQVTFWLFFFLLSLFLKNVCSCHLESLRWRFFFSSLEDIFFYQFFFCLFAWSPFFQNVSHLQTHCLVSQGKLISKVGKFFSIPQCSCVNALSKSMIYHPANIK